MQFIDRVVDDPAAMQRQASTIKKRRKAEGQDQDVDVERFKDLVLPSSQSCLCVSIASSDEGGDEADGEEEELKQHAEATSLVQGREHRREEDETDTQVPGGELVQVAPNMGAGGSLPQATMDQEWDKELREIRRMIEFLVLIHFLKELNPWSSSTEEPLHSSTVERSEWQEQDQDLRCQSGQSAKNSVIFSGGDSSNNYGADQQRLQISDLHFDKFHNQTTFACWKIRFKTEICTCSQFSSEAMLWIIECQILKYSMRRLLQH